MKKPAVYKIENCTISNNATPISDKAAEAALALANAAMANANAIERIAEAIKGSEAHMGAGISIAGEKQ